MYRSYNINNKLHHVQGTSGLRQLARDTGESIRSLREDGLERYNRNMKNLQYREALLYSVDSALGTKRQVAAAVGFLKSSGLQIDNLELQINKIKVMLGPSTMRLVGEELFTFYNQDGTKMTADIINKLFNLGKGEVVKYEDIQYDFDRLMESRQHREAFYFSMTHRMADEAIASSATAMFLRTFLHEQRIDDIIKQIKPSVSRNVFMQIGKNLITDSLYKGLNTQIDLIIEKFELPKEFVPGKKEYIRLVEAKIATQDPDQIRSGISIAFGRDLGRRIIVKSGAELLRGFLEKTIILESGNDNSTKYELNLPNKPSMRKYFDEFNNFLPRSIMLSIGNKLYKESIDNEKYNNALFIAQLFDLSKLKQRQAFSLRYKELTDKKSDSYDPAAAAFFARDFGEKELARHAAEMARSDALIAGHFGYATHMQIIILRLDEKPAENGAIKAVKRA